MGTEVGWGGNRDKMEKDGIEDGWAKRENKGKYKKESDLKDR